MPANGGWRWWFHSSLHTVNVQNAWPSLLILSLYSTTCTLSRAWNPGRVSTSGPCAFLPVSHILTSLLDHIVEAGAEERKKKSQRDDISQPDWQTSCLFLLLSGNRFYVPSTTAPHPTRASDRLFSCTKARLPVAPQGRSRKTVLTLSHRRGALVGGAACSLCLCSPAFSQPDSAADATIEEFRSSCQFLCQRVISGGNHGNQTWQWPTLPFTFFYFLSKLSAHRFLPGSKCASALQQNICFWSYRCI